MSDPGKCSDVYLVLRIIDATTGSIELKDYIDPETDLVAYTARHLDVCQRIHEQAHTWVLELVDPDTDQVIMRSSSDPARCQTPVAIDSPAGRAYLRRLAADTN